MALFVDGPSATVDDLTDQDSGLLDVAQTCGINVTTKLRLAHDEIGADLQLWLNRPRPTLEMVWGPTLRMAQIVATAPLKRWETMQAIALFYRDAYFSQLADRYQGKWDEFARLTRDAYEKFLAAGVGLVNDPLPQPEPPVLGSVPAPQSGGTFYASVAWVNAGGQCGQASAASALSIQDGNLMTIAAVNPPANATGFHVYAGATVGSLIQQDDVALPTGTTLSYIPGARTQGIAAGMGQQPDYVRPLRRTMLRG